VNLSSRIFNEDLVLTTNFSSAVCFLTEDITVTFPERIQTTDVERINEICCPTVISVKVDSFLSCFICRKKAEIMTGTVPTAKVDLLWLSSKLFQIVKKFL